MKISVKVKPSAKSEKIEKNNKNNFIVFVKAPAKEGKANEAVIKALAKHFSVSRSAVSIVSGVAAKQKIIEVCL